MIGFSSRLEERAEKRKEVLTYLLNHVVYNVSLLFISIKLLMYVTHILIMFDLCVVLFKDRGEDSCERSGENQLARKVKGFGL